MPHVNIIARTNGVGLDQDVGLIRNVLTDAGFQVTISHCRSIPAWSALLARKKKFDANIFLERVFPRWLSLAGKNWLIPNQERFPRRHLKHLNKVDTVLCKTRHALDIFSQYTDSRYIGFSSTDRERPGVEKAKLTCFHLAGRSTLKGTETILDLWRSHPSWPELTLVQCSENSPDSVPENVRLIAEHITPGELITQLNQHTIHICTSLSEGWGHYIVEAMSCQAVVVTTDAPPMNEIVTHETGILVPYKREEPRHLGTNFYADPEALANRLEQAFQLSRSKKQQYGKNARNWFEANHLRFTNDFPKVILNLLT